MHIAKNKPSEQKVIFIARELSKKFCFKCQKCSNCCSMSKILLYPFDIMALCKAQGISSEEFSSKYSYFIIDDKKRVRCFLRTNPVCYFNDRLCNVYENRPLRCRLFPCGRMYKKGKWIYLLPDRGCSGFSSGKKQTIEEWIADIPKELTEMSDQWHRFMARLARSKLPLDDRLLQMFFIKIFYDFDNELVARELPMFSELKTKEKMAALYELAEKYIFGFEEVKKALEKLGPV